MLDRIVQWVRERMEPAPQRDMGSETRLEVMKERQQQIEAELAILEARSRILSHKD